MRGTQHTGSGEGLVGRCDGEEGPHSSNHVGCQTLMSGRWGAPSCVRDRDMVRLGRECSRGLEWGGSGMGRTRGRHQRTLITNDHNWGALSDGPLGSPAVNYEECFSSVRTTTVQG